MIYDNMICDNCLKYDDCQNFTYKRIQYFFCHYCSYHSKEFIREFIPSFNIITMNCIKCQTESETGFYRDKFFYCSNYCLDKNKNNS